MEIRHELTQGQQLLTIELHLKIVPSPLCEPAMSWPLTPVVHEIQDGQPPRDGSFLFLSITQGNVRVSHQITIVNKKLRFFLKFIVAAEVCTRVVDFVMMDCMCSGVYVIKLTRIFVS